MLLHCLLLNGLPMTRLHRQGEERAGGERRRREESQERRRFGVKGIRSEESKRME
jgi:hypothetical protein